MKYQDIQIPDVDLQRQFAENWMNGNYQEAFNILKNNPQLDSKKFVNEVVNRIADSLTIVESFYHEDFTNGLNIKLDAYNAMINDFIFRKEWNSATPYKIGNSVNLGVDTYFCIQNNTNITPPNDAYWVKLEIRGDVGPTGIDATFKYAWDSGTAYIKNDIVSLGEYLWICTQSNSNQEPMEGSTYWAKFLYFPKIVIYTSHTPPVRLYDGLIWIRAFYWYVWREVNKLNYTFRKVNSLGITWKEVNQGGW